LKPSINKPNDPINYANYIINDQQNRSPTSCPGQTK